MSNSINLNLPYLLSNQAQKHVTHNEALKMLDVLVQLSVVDNTLSAPPQSPSEGDSYTIASSPTGVWTGKEAQVTIWHDGAWSFYPPNKGWITWVESNNTLQAYNGTDWVVASGYAGGISSSDLSDGTITTLGINANADTGNRLSVNSSVVLFNKEVDDVQVKLNKQSPTDNASFLFQTGYSGRAEIGLTGDDDFHFKISGDGTTWNEAFIIDKDNGHIGMNVAPDNGTLLKLKGNTNTNHQYSLHCYNSSGVSLFRVHDNGRVETANNHFQASLTGVSIGGLGFTKQLTYTLINAYNTTENHRIQLFNSTAYDCFIDIEGWIKYKAYTVASAPTASGMEGSVIYLSDGDAGSECLAVSVGANWKVIALGATISST